MLVDTVDLRKKNEVGDDILSYSKMVSNILAFPANIALNYSSCKWIKVCFSTSSYMQVATKSRNMPEQKLLCLTPRAKGCQSLGHLPGIC